MIFILFLGLFFLYCNKINIYKEDEEIQNDKFQVAENEFQISGKDEQEKRENGEKNFNAEEDFLESSRKVVLKGRKIELTDYLELSIEEFVEETGIFLFQDTEENVWKTKDDMVYVETDDNGIAYLSISKLMMDNKSEELPDTEKVCYTIAGISLNDELSVLEKTILKNATKETGGGCYSYYTSLELSRLGIERMTLIGTPVDSIEIYIDLSLKESSKDLKCNWEEKIIQKEGEQNDKLRVCENPYEEMQIYDKQEDKIDKTLIWIKYPYFDIAEKPEMTQNINYLIAETVKRIEDETYRKTDENIIVQADYMITYMTSKFISITFRVYVVGDDIDKRPWQYCNINLLQNGKGATLSDIGLTREQIVTACNASLTVADTENYLKGYDKNWYQYRITPVKYVLYVKSMNEETQNEYDFIPVELFRTWYG